MFLSKCAMYDNKILMFMKKQETRGLLSSLGIRTSSKVSLLGNILL